MRVVVDSNEDSWNYFAATETITRPSTANSAGLTSAATQTVLSIERTLGANNSWSTSNAYDPPSPIDAQLTAAPPQFSIAQLHADDSGTLLTATASDGANVAPAPDLVTTYGVEPPPPGISPLQGFPAPPPGWQGVKGLQAPPTLRALRLPAVRSSVDRSQRDPRAWLGNIVVTVRSRAQMATARAKRFGPRIGMVGSYERYLLQHDSLTIEELVDPTIGALVEHNVSIAGRLLAHTTHSYVSLGDGRYVLAGVRMEVAQGAGRPNRTIEVRLDNIDIERR